MDVETYDKTQKKTTETSKQLVRRIKEQITEGV